MPNLEHPKAGEPPSEGYGKTEGGIPIIGKQPQVVGQGEMNKVPEAKKSAESR